MKLGFKRGEKGFTLVELMVVMAILAILAAIVIPPVTGTKQVSLDSQVKQDATVAQTAVGQYNADANLAEALTTDNATNVLGTSASQVTSNKWSETKMTATYNATFPITNTVVTSVLIQDEDGVVLYGTGQTKTLANFVADYNAINIATLVTEGYLQEEPNGVDAIFSSSKPYHNYLWLVKKVYVGDDPDGGRSVEVFSLITVNISGSTEALIYQRIF